MELIKKISAPTLYLLLAGLAMWQSVSNPMNNWDMIGYMAAAKSYEEPDAGALHRFTYEQLRRSVSPPRYRVLVSRGGNTYRETMHADPGAFAEQLPFYQIRPVYTGLIYLFYKAGINIKSATHLVSGMAVAAAAALLYLLARRFLKGFLVYALPPLALVFGVVDLARFSTPDGLACCAMVLAAWFFMTNRMYGLFLLLPVMIGIRTDLILFVLPLLVSRIFIDKEDKWRVLICALACVGVYALIVSAWQSHSWSTTFYFTLVQAVTHPASLPPELTVRDYVTALARGGQALLESKVLILYGLLTAYAICLLNVRAKVCAAAALPLLGLTLSGLFYGVSHFMLLPAVWDRFYSGAALIGAFALLAVVTEHFQTHKEGP